MNPRTDLEALARRLGVASHYRDGLGQDIEVADATLVRLCAALGAPIERADDAADALAWLAAREAAATVPPVLVAWDGVLPPVAAPVGAEAVVGLEEDRDWRLEPTDGGLRSPEPLPWGYHRLLIRDGQAGEHGATVISAPVHSWRRDRPQRSWGLGAHLAALRSTRSRSVGDLRDLETVAAWIAQHGGDLLTVLPLLPTFNDPPPEPSPYAPVSRLFWSELILDLSEQHRATPPPERLDVVRAGREVAEALAGVPFPSQVAIDDELRRYARFRGAQARLGRNWRVWPERARSGELMDDMVDPEVEAMHLKAQVLLRSQLDQVHRRLGDRGVRLGLDLAVGVHPDGYDPWSRQQLFAAGISVGAPPDPGFPSGQDWGFPPVLPTASRAEGHAYLTATLRHQARLAGVLRIDHVMAFRRLYWIPQGMSLDQGSYVDYPAEELFAIATLESHRQRCELVGENLGTVPEEMHDAMSRHGVKGMYVAQFAAHGEPIEAPAASEVASIGTHDTPTFAGWLGGEDIPERLSLGLLTPRSAPREQARRADAVMQLADHLDTSARRPGEYLDALLAWLGSSASPLVIAWLEDLWLEPEAVNLPGTGSAARPNWQRPMAKMLDDISTDPELRRRLVLLDRARTGAGTADDELE